MADNTARAREQIMGHRRAILEHVEKYKKYSDANDKRFALKTIENAQRHIAKLKSDHPSLMREHDRLDSWTP